MDFPYFPYLNKEIRVYKNDYLKRNTVPFRVRYVVKSVEEDNEIQ